jgi:Trk K+ transport system NAD-binding subunit
MKWYNRLLQSRRERLIGYYLVAVLAAIVAYTVVYDVAIEVFEGESRPWFHSLGVVVESMTTTGYGEDAPWSTAEMYLLSIAMQATGVVFLFTALPVIALPLLQEALANRAPSSIPSTEDHVVICAGVAHAEALIDDLESEDVEYVVVEPDRERATDLFDDGLEVVHGDPESAEDLKGVHVADARSVVVEAGDEVNTSIVLAVKSIAPEVPVASVTERVEREEYHRLAGADEVFSPRELLGERRGKKASTTVTEDLDEAVAIGEDFELVELAVHSGSELVGKRLRETKIRERTGANVVGAWIDGEFYVPPFDARLDENTVLLVGGSESQCEALNDLTLSSSRQHGNGTAVVAGHGETGQAVVDVLAERGIDHSVIDVVDQPSVDVVADATDPETLREAGIDDAQSVVLALGNDADTVFATLVARELSPEVEIIARANDRESVRKIYRAGADYVLALSRVTGRLLAASVLGEDLLSVETQVKVVRAPADHLAGQTIAGADVRSRTGCTVIGVERNGETITGPEPDFELAAGDDVVVAGTDEGIAAFRELS